MSARARIFCHICGEGHVLESRGSQREAAKSLRWILKEEGWKNLDTDPLCPACAAVMEGVS
jgi:hypothetical protein